MRNSHKALGVKRKYFPRERLSTAFLWPDFRTGIAAAAETTPQRPDSATRGGRGTRTASGRGEPHPTVMRTLAASPKGPSGCARELALAGPGTPTFPDSPPFKSDWLTLPKACPVRHGWRLGRIVRAMTPLFAKVAIRRGSGGSWDGHKPSSFYGDSFC